MPTLLIHEGFKFFFYANEHQPLIIHVEKGNGYARIELSTLNVTENYFKTAELKKVLTLVDIHRDFFVEKWYEFFS
jgi:hypothetical protein